MTYIQPKCKHPCAGCLHEKFLREKADLAKRARTSHSAFHEYLYPGGIGCPFCEEKKEK